MAQAFTGDGVLKEADIPSPAVLHYTNEMRTYITHAIRKFAQRNATLIELDRRVTYNMVKAMRGRRLNPLCCTLSFAAVVYIPPFKLYIGFNFVPLLFVPETS